MAMVTAAAVKELRKRINVGASVAHELLVLAGGDILLAEEASKKSKGLDQCKAAILDKRIRMIEEELWEMEEE